MNNPPTTPFLSPKYAVSYSTMLAEHLAHRPVRNGRFHLGEWLEALDEAILHQLDACIESVLNCDLGAHNAFPDLVRLCEIAYAAEKCRATMPRTPKGLIKVIGELQAVASVIGISRLGLIKLCGPVGLSSRSAFKYALTASGRQMGGELGLLARA